MYVIKQRLAGLFLPFVWKGSSLDKKTEDSLRVK